MSNHNHVITPGLGTFGELENEKGTEAEACQLRSGLVGGPVDVESSDARRDCCIRR